jgi:hypothetical protein
MASSLKLEAVTPVHCVVSETKNEILEEILLFTNAMFYSVFYYSASYLNLKELIRSACIRRIYFI